MREALPGFLEARRDENPAPDPALLDELSWFDYVKLGLQVAAFIASLLLPATAGARVARMVIVLASALTALVEKVTRIVKLTGE